MDEDSQYTSICNNATLQSDKKGFFLAYTDEVLELAGTQWIEGFRHLKSDAERLRKCYNDPSLYEVIHGVLQNVQPLYRGKSAKLSQLRRMEGERAARDGKNERALLLLTQAVIRAPGPGEDSSVDDGLSLALASWSRAQTLWQLSNYSPCLADLQMCLKEKLPEQLRVEAYWLMSQCYENLSEIKKAKVTLQVILKLLGPDNAKWREKVKNELTSLPTTIDQNKTLDDTNKEELLEGQHPHFPGLSAAVSLQTSESAGRYIVARQPIRTGDVLATESPYTACLLPDKFGSHCHHCFSRLRYAVACKQCSGLAFCSMTCRDTAAASYHKYECRYMDLMIGSGMSILCHVALRTVTQQKYAYWQRVYKHQSVTPDYNRLARLVTHADRRTPKDFIRRTLMALFLLRILEHSKYIPLDDCSDDDLKGMHLFLSCVLLHLLQCLQFNAHEIYETIYKRALDFSSFKTHYIGVGVYTSVALLNHDCYPAITRYFRGKELVARAVRPLNPGNIVAENYGPIFTLRTLEDRQHSLMSRYWFTCACNACTQNWPKLVDMDEKDTNIRCQKKSCEGFIRVSNNKKGKSHCPNCGDTINATEAALLVKSYYSDYQQGLLLMKEGKFQEAMPLFSAFSDAMDQISCPPNKNVSLVQEALRQCWSYHHNKHVLDQ